MRNRDKLKLARKHMTRSEIKNRVSPFQSKWWEARKAKIAKKVIIRERTQKALALLKRQQKQKNETP